MQTAKDILIAARELISDPKSWTQREYARDEKGNSVQSRSETAVCWCAVGAIERNTLDFDASVSAHTALRVAATEHKNFREGAICPDIATFNDSHTHAEVLALFDEAIEYA